MSMGVGVSDIIYFINKTLKLYGQCKDAPAELQAAGRNVEQMRTALEVLASAIADKKSLIAKQPAIALMIKHEIKPLKADLSGINAILTDHIDKSKNMGMIGRLRYAILDHDKLQNIEANLTRSRTNFGLMLDLINIKAHEQHASNDRASLGIMEKILTKQAAEVNVRKAESKAREKGDAKIEEIFQILQDRLPVAAIIETENVSPSKVLDQLEKELQKAGLSKQKAQAARLNAAQALSEKSASESRPSSPRPKDSSDPKSSLLRPGKDPLGNRRISDPVPRPDPMTSLRRNKSNPNPNLVAADPKKTQNFRILCVDDTHGIRAILAHAYLEVLRVWTANRSGRWLFKRVHSAGCSISTNFKKSLGPVAKQAVEELLPMRKGYDWDMDFPFETQRISAYLRVYSPHGFSASDWKTYDIILCFTKHAADDLIKLQDLDSDKRARIVILPGCKDISSKDCVNDPKKIGQLVGSIKTAIKGFISEELGDWSDGFTERIQDYRTLQLVLPDRELTFIERGESVAGGDKLKEYERLSGCVIKVAKYEGGKMKEFMISIIGPKDRLAEAARLIQPGWTDLNLAGLI